MQTSIRRCKNADTTNDGEGYASVSYARLTLIFCTFGLRSMMMHGMRGVHDSSKKLEVHD